MHKFLKKPKKWTWKNVTLFLTLFICQYMFWTVLEFTVISRTKNWSKICQKYRFCPPWNRNHQSGSWILCWDIFNDHLCSYMIDTDMRECILSCVRVHVISRAQNVVKNMRIMPILAPWILIFQSGALILFKTSSMTIYGHIWLKLIFQHAFWPVIGFMMIFRTKNRSKICQKHWFCPP